MYILNVIFGDVMTIKLSDILFENQDKSIEDYSVQQTGPDSVIQSFVDDNKEKIEKQKNLNELINEATLFNLLMNNKKSRTEAGAKGQSIAKDILKNYFKEKYEINSNKIGSTSEDITVYDQSGNLVSNIEIKYIDSFTLRPISFFDKTISETKKITGPFFNLVKKIIEKNSIQVSGDNVYDAFKSLQAQQPESLKFSDLPSDLTKFFINPLNPQDLEYQFNDSSGNTMRSSHKAITNIKNGAIYFKPSKTPSENQIIYLQRKEVQNENNIKKEINKYSYVRVKEENNNLIPIRVGITLSTIHKINKRPDTPRAAGTPGKMSKKYFSVNKKNMDKEIKNVTYESIKDKYTEKHYLGIISSKELRIICMNEENPLGIDGIGVFNQDNIENVKLRPQAASEVGKLRVGLECKINYNGFKELT